MTLPYSVRWLAPAPAVGPRRARWSVWHAAVDPAHTLCGQPIRDRASRGETVRGTAPVECRRCARALARVAAAEPQARAGRLGEPPEGGPATGPHGPAQAGTSP